MKNDEKLPQRKSIRLNGYDYSHAGAYFVTICVQNRVCLFGDVVNDEMVLNEFGAIAYHEWVKLPERFSNVELDVFQIMPNHMHGIIVLNDNRASTIDLAIARVAPTVGNIVGAYKSLLANNFLKLYKLKNETMGKIWQRNYYEHIIRDERSYQSIVDYIVNNPRSWADDKLYPYK